jgi:hypothetical protein
MASTDPVEQNIIGVRQLVGSKTNKLNSGVGVNAEGVEGEFEDEFTLKRSDEELLFLSKQWEYKYLGYEAKIKQRQEANKTYYLGRQKDGNAEVGENPISSNILFEAEETFLPAALAKNPEPVVWSDNTEEGNKIATSVKTMLQYHADTLVLRRKLTLMTRHWSIYFLGAMKHGWDDEIKDIKTDVIDPQRLILDPDSTIDSYGDYDGHYIGERKTCTADKLCELFPKHKAYITVLVNGKMGTDVTYTEWWSDEYCFYTFKDKVLSKDKNPHFNYPKMVPGIASDGTPDIDENGQAALKESKGINHFAKPKKPYTFLSVFSLGEHPHDDTGLIEQNIPNQNRITKRELQIDRNLDNANNGLALSEDNFNQENAKQAAVARIKGNPILVPSGRPISEAIVTLPSAGIPDAFFKAADRDKQDLRSIFGTEGISSQPAKEETTARGMILNQQFDNSRIGGGIGDALEQVADNVFNWWVQLYCVYYDEPHFAAIMGQMKAVEYITLQATDLDRRIVVSVAADSMKPKDEITQMNQAMSLFERGALDPKTLLTMLNIPDAQKTSESTVLWLLDKNAYLQLNFPELAQQLAQIQQANAMQVAAAGAPPGGGSPVPGSPPESLSTEPASAALSQVKLPK